MRVKLVGGGDGIELVMLDDKNITDSVAAIEIKIAATAEVKLILQTEVTAELQDDLLFSLEKKQHVRFNTLDNKSRFVRVKDAS